MKIDKGSLVAVDVRMYDAQGNLLEESEEPLVYLQGHDDIFPGIEDALQGKESGFETSISLQPQDAFGEYDPELISVVPLGELGDDVEVGASIDGLPGDRDAGRTYVVTDIAADVAVLDGNHPLAGRTLRFDIKVVSVEAATEEDLVSAEASARIVEVLLGDDDSDENSGQSAGARSASRRLH
jgi:FKBP-type peptidyl-prolyl cis-trans isomerase SlyD